MFFERIYDESLAQASYIVGCQAKGVAIVIDPKRDIDTYLEVADRNNLQITKVTETHIHADFLSGSRELAAVTGAALYLSDEGGADWQYEFDHIGLKDGDIIEVGNLTLAVMHAPGHTPESVSFLLTDHPASALPIMVFTGDFVFVGDIGRPDLLEKAAGWKGTSVIGAKQMFHSLQRFLELPDYVQLWPGHGAGSSCGKALGSVPSSTVGYERIRNWALLQVDEEKFVAELLEGQPEAPTYFAMMKKLNKTVRPLLVEIPQIPLLTPAQFVAYQGAGAIVIDTRAKELFLNGHLAGALNIQLKRSFATWAGWTIPYNRPLILIAESEQVEELIRLLMRIGLDEVVGYISEITELGLPLQSTPAVSMEDVKAVQGDPSVQLIDVRNAVEYEAGHIPGARHIMWGKMEAGIPLLNSDQETVVYCQSGDRATIASSVLRRNGFENVKIYTGSMADWRAKGQEVE